MLADKNIGVARGNTPDLIARKRRKVTTAGKRGYKQGTGNTIES